jgi:Cu/Ag efflux protein CusF
MSEIPTQSVMDVPEPALESELEPAPERIEVGGVDLDSDPFADDLSAQLAAAAPKRWTDRATLILSALFLLVGGFLGGVQVQKHYGSSSAANPRGAPAAFTGRGLGGGAGAGTGTGTGSTASASPSAAATAQTGTIKLVDGTTIYIQLASDDVLTVRTGATTHVSVGSATKVSQLTVGTKVAVTGPTTADGTITATAITAAP